MKFLKKSIEKFYPENNTEATNNEITEIEHQGQNYEIQSDSDQQKTKSKLFLILPYSEGASVLKNH